VFRVIDCFTKQCHALTVDTSFSNRWVTQALGQAIHRFGKLLRIRCDNGPEVCSPHFPARAIEEQIDVGMSAKIKPLANCTSRPQSNHDNRILFFLSAFHRGLL
jgi:putative transposase